MAYIREQGDRVGFWEKILGSEALGAFADRVDANLPADLQYQPGQAYSVDWCRFRTRSTCMLPKKLDEAASTQAGYAVWVPHNRGPCPRDGWSRQITKGRTGAAGLAGSEGCPVSQPGEESGEPDRLINVHKPWAQGGQRNGQVR